MTDATSGDGQADTKWGHPAGLFVLFFVELWERFSYYGMRALLVLYMTKQLLFSDAMSYGIYGAYGSLVYATPVIGGLLADRLLGYRRAIVLGAVLMALGHFGMTFDAEVLSSVLGGMATQTGTNSIELAISGGTYTFDATMFFYGALALLVIGNGFFKPNISSLVGRLYDDDEIDEGKRDGGFTIFYMGINIGALLAPLTCGAIGETYGWHYGFGLAGVGMVVGLVIFLAYEDVLGDHGYSPNPDYLETNFPPEIPRSNVFQYALAAVAGGGVLILAAPAIGSALGAVSAPVVGEGATTYVTKIVGLIGWAAAEIGILAFLLSFVTNETATYVGSIVAIPNLAYLCTRTDVIGGLLALMGFVVLGWLLLYALKSEKEVRERLFVILVLLFFSMCFWAFFEQAGSSINLFTDRNVDRTIFGWTVPASVFQSVNPFYIIALAPIFSWLWDWLHTRDWEPSTPVKFGLGIIQLGLGFGMFVLGAATAGSDGLVAVWYLLLGYMLITTGELCLSPVGLSMVTKLSPKATVGVVMGAWFFAVSFAHYLSAVLAQFASAPKGENIEKMPPSETLPIYTELFWKIGVVAVAVGFVCLLVSPILKRWMHGVD